MGAYSYSGTAASNTSIDGIGAAGSSSPANLDDLHRAQGAALANFVRDLGGATAGGTADALTISLNDATTLPAYFDQMIVGFKAANTNTGAATVNIDSVGSKKIRKAGDVALAAGDITSGRVYWLRYHSAWDSAAGAFQLIDLSIGAGLLSNSNTFTGTNTFTGPYTEFDQSSGFVTIKYTDDSASGGSLYLQKDSTTPADADVLFDIDVRGYDSGANVTTYCQLRFEIEDVTDTTEDGLLRWRLIRAGSLATRMVVADGLLVGGATGGDKGAGTINAVAVYDDNTLLTCYIGDVVDGDSGDEVAVDTAALVAKWDALVPDRILPPEYKLQQKTDHETGEPMVDAKGKPVMEEVEVIPERVEPRQHFGARKFLQRIGTQYDPRDIAKAMKHFKDKKHLTNMPNPATYVHGSMSTGDWIQRLIEQAELNMVWVWKERRARINFQQQAQATIAALEARIAALEGN